MSESRLVSHFGRRTIVSRRDMEELNAIAGYVIESVTLEEAKRHAKQIQNILQYHETDDWTIAMAPKRDALRESSAS